MTAHRAVRFAARHQATPYTRPDPAPDWKALAALTRTPTAEDRGWWEYAACREVDPDAFFPGKDEDVRAAKRVCVKCPVRAECLADALENDIRFGVWGGLSTRQRRRLQTRPTNRGAA